MCEIERETERDRERQRDRDRERESKNTRPLLVMGSLGQMYYIMWPNYGLCYIVMYIFGVGFFSYNYIGAKSIMKYVWGLVTRNKTFK